jgi:hypothetical protein
MSFMLSHRSLSLVFSFKPWHDPACLDNTKLKCLMTRTLVSQNCLRKIIRNRSSGFIVGANNKPKRFKA